MTTGRTVQTLNSLKERLGSLLDESEWLTKEIGAKTEQLGKATEDNTVVKAETQGEKRVAKRLGQQSAETDGVPQVLEYISQKAEMYELQDTLANWQRKVEIMEMAARRARGLARQAGGTEMMSQTR
jgi:regulator of replication initiation timing